jgi:hypothetical protein
VGQVAQDHRALRLEVLEAPEVEAAVELIVFNIDLLQCA